MRMAPTLILVIALLIAVPAIASATHGRSGAVIKTEQVIIYTTHYASNHDRGRSHYHQQRNNSYRLSNRSVRQPPRHAPAYGYHKKHYRSVPDKQYRHRPSQSRGHISVQVPSIIVHIGF